VRVNRGELLRHLRRVSCRGRVKEVVFLDALATKAMTPDYLLLVLAPGLGGEEPLTGEMGVTELDTLIRACTMLADGPDAEGDEVELMLRDNRLVLEEPRGGRIKWLTAAPRTIATRVDQSIVDKLTANIGTIVVPLTPELVNDVRATFSGLKAEEVEVIVGPEGGMIRVGDEHRHAAELPVPALRADTGFSFTFGEHLIDALSSVVDAAAVLYLNGPKLAVVVQDGDYHYFVSPIAPASGRKRAAAPEGAAAAAPATKPKVKARATKPKAAKSAA
jgi:hypothetical protein